MVEQISIAVQLQPHYFIAIKATATTAVSWVGTKDAIALAPRIEQILTYRFWGITTVEGTAEPVSRRFDFVSRELFVFATGCST